MYRPQGHLEARPARGQSPRRFAEVKMTHAFFRLLMAVVNVNSAW